MRIVLFIAILMIIFGCQQKTSDKRAINIPTDDAILKDELIIIAKRVYDEGLTSGTGGDISVRIGNTNQFIII